MPMVQRRHVLFIGGYDPKGGRRLHAEHSQQAALYQQLTQQPLRMTAADGATQHSLVWEMQTQDIQTRFECLRWDDLVRRRWARTPSALVREALASLFEFVRTGALRHMWRLSHPLVYAAMLPYGLALLAIFLPLLLAFAFATIALGFNWSQETALTGSWLTLWFAALLGYHWLRAAPSTWFLRVVAFARQYAHESPPSVGQNPGVNLYRARVAEWVDLLAPRLATTDADEILIVGYSAGSILAASLLPSLIAALPPQQKRKIALLTLGNCLPVAACLPTASALRTDLIAIARLNEADGIPWLDITSPTDWGSLFDVDVPSAYADMPTSRLRRQLSPRFHMLFTPASYKALKRDKYRVHQQYLQVTELRGNTVQDYDYFALVAGPLSLCERYWPGTR